MSERKKRYSTKAWFCLPIFFLGSFLVAQGQVDLPNPPANFQSIPAGSLVIPMDNNLQAIVPAGQAPFNLKAYGLVNQFLQNGIPVKWAISSSKIKDGIDFSAQAERIAPSALASANLDFRSGPFIVPDTVLPCGLSTQEIISSFGNNVTVYRLTNSTMADIRYTLTHRPKIAVFNNGGNELIHTKILDAAGIGDYDVMDAADIANLINCYTFASEPHADENEVSLAVIDGIRAFVLNGGNFLAQCHAIDTYENRGFFHTTAGVSIVNSTTSHLYPNANLAYSQIQGHLQQNEGGSIGKWTLASGSSWRNTSYPSVTHLNSDTVIAMGAHLTAPNAPGGNVFYLGGHDYSRGGGGGGANPIPNLTTLERVNGLRMYLNTVFVPSKNSNGAWANAGVPSVTLACSDSAVLGCTLTGPPGSTFLWTPATGLSCTSCANPVARPSVSTTYRVQVTNGCTAFDTVRVLVASKPIAQFANTTVCQGDSTRFTDQTTVASFWRWNFGDGASGTDNVSALQNPKHVFSTSGSFTVTLISGNTPSCSDTITKTITVSPLPIISVNSPIICAGNSATLTASGATNYQWSTGASTNSITVNPIVTTKYKVIGRTAAGCRDSVTTTITVSPSIVSTTSKTDVSCFGGNNGTATVSFTGGIAPHTFSWNTIPIQTTSKAVGLVAGTYAVIVKDSISCADTISATIAEPAPLVLTTTISHVKCHNGTDGSASVVASGGISPYIYNWNTVPVQTNATASSLKSGSYNVIVADSNSCKDTALVTINQPTPILLIVSIGDTLCVSKGSASISATGGIAPYTYLWNTSPAQTTDIVNNLAAGDYAVTVKDSNLCEVDTLVKLRLPVKPLADFSATNTCLGSAANSFVDKSTASTGTITTWNWNFGQPSSGAANVSSIQNPSHLYNLAGNYTAELIVSTSQGCKDTVTKLVEVYPLPIVRFGSPTGGCENACLAFTDSSSVSTGSIQSWNWNFGNAISTQQNPIYCYPNSGSYDVSLSVISNQGCTANLLKSNAIQIVKSPVVNLGPDQKICWETQKDAAPVLDAGAGYKYKWLPNFDTTQRIIVTSPATYSVVVTNEQNCTATSSVRIREVCPPRAFVSNSFTPNGDGINDQYTIYGEHIGSFQMLIFNRWGEIIFETKDKNLPWDGIYKGEPMPIGVYPWLITYTGDSEEYYGPYRMNGSVTVVR